MTRNRDACSVSFHPHATNNWNDRTPRDAHGLPDAWRVAHPIGYVRQHYNNNPDHDPCDEIRLYHGVTQVGEEYSMLIFKRGDTVVTSYPYDGATDHLVEAYLDKLEQATTYYE